jgi:hypothetical protein
MPRVKQPVRWLWGALVVALASVASAMPGDPPIRTLLPLNGSHVPAGEGLNVTFACPEYVIDIEEPDDEEEGDSEKDPGEEEDEEEEGEGKGKAEKVTGDADDYGVRFSTSPTIGPDGRLTTAGFGEDDGDAPADAELDKVTCDAELPLPNEPISSDLYAGTIYWQAYRSCEACDPAEYETGPVDSVVITPDVEEPDLEFEDHVYADYTTRVSFSSDSELIGGQLALQSWNGDEWVAMSRLPADEDGDTAFFVKFDKRGELPLRVVVTAPGVNDALKPKLLNVRKVAKKWSVDASDDGIYRTDKNDPSGPAHFKVTARGRVLEKLRAWVPATCETGDTSAHVGAAVALKRARIAPDGTVVAKATTHGATPAVVTLVGNLEDRVLSGELTTTFLNCTGSRDLEADLGPASRG